MCYLYTTTLGLMAARNDVHTLEGEKNCFHELLWWGGGKISPCTPQYKTLHDYSYWYSYAPNTPDSFTGADEVRT